jgi:hypothetical protein
MCGKSSGGSVATDEGSVVATVAGERDVPMHNASQIVGPTSTHFGGPLESGFEPNFQSRPKIGASIRARWRWKNKVLLIKMGFKHVSGFPLEMLLARLRPRKGL